VVAYEPVWAIGAKTPATPAEAQEAHLWIRTRAGAVFGAATAEVLPILYGGGVTEENVRVLFEQPDVDGALVGGASLNVVPFAHITRLAAETAPK
jgi:triosephosphate isomerase